jgi:hypothetical protein
MHRRRELLIVSRKDVLPLQLEKLSHRGDWLERAERRRDRACRVKADTLDRLQYRCSRGTQGVLLNRSTPLRLHQLASSFADTSHPLA